MGSFIPQMDSARTLINVNDQFEFPLTGEQIELIPYLRENKTIRVQYAEERHMVALVQVASCSPLYPMELLASHRDMYVLLQLINLVGLSEECIELSLYAWTNRRKWLKLEDIEYLYPVYSLNNDMCDFRLFFRYHKTPFDSLKLAMELPEVRSNPVLYIEMLLFYKNFDFASCFDHNNNVVKAQIRQLTEARTALWELFMVNPHADFMREYFEHTPILDDVWRCKGISVHRELVPGEMTIVSADTFKQRTHAFSHGLIGDDFPCENVIIAGGSVSKLLSVDYEPRKARQSDVDIFVYGESHADKLNAFTNVIDWFKKQGSIYYAIRGSVVTIYIKDIARKFQIISSNAATPADIIGKFDMSHIQWYNLNGVCYGTPEACQAMREKVSRLNNILRLKIIRIVKAAYCGYDIHKENALKSGVADLITPVITNDTELEPVLLQKYIRELHGFWYPRSEPDMTPEEEREYILCQITKDCNGLVVTDHPLIAMENVTIGGNFDSDYELIHFSTFNINQVTHTQFTRDGNLQVYNHTNQVSLITDKMEVSRVIINAGAEITTIVNSAEFGRFVDIIEGPLYQMNRREPLESKLIRDNEITFKIPEHVLQRQDVRGVPIMRSKNGLGLNIEEDLQAGDEVQIVFLIQINRGHGGNSITFIPRKIIKYVKFDINEAEKIINEEEHIDDEIKQLMQANDFDVELGYVELDI